MKKTFLLISIIIVCIIYFIPLCIIAAIAFICAFTGIHNDITKTRIILFIIHPIVYLEDKIGELE